MGRIVLAVFTLPIVARMCGLPNTQLIIPHNIACCAAMFLIFVYVLRNLPRFLSVPKDGFTEIRTTVAHRGIGAGKRNTNVRDREFALVFRKRDAVAQTSVG